VLRATSRELLDGKSWKVRGSWLKTRGSKRYANEM
jgi:hypothetical protein